MTVFVLFSCEPNNGLLRGIFSTFAGAEKWANEHNYKHGWTITEYAVHPDDASSWSTKQEPTK